MNRVLDVLSYNDRFKSSGVIATWKSLLRIVEPQSTDVVPKVNGHLPAPARVTNQEDGVPIKKRREKRPQAAKGDIDMAVDRDPNIQLSRVSKRRKTENKGVVAGDLSIARTDGHT